MKTYTYPATSPKAGQQTTIKEQVWECPLCHYTSNLADDIAEHKQLAKKVNTLNGAGRKVKLYKFAFSGNGKRVVWERYGENMEDCLRFAKNAAIKEYGDKACNFSIYSPQSPCGHYACDYKAN